MVSVGRIPGEGRQVNGMRDHFPFSRGSERVFAEKRLVLGEGFDAAFKLQGEPLRR